MDRKEFEKERQRLFEQAFRNGINEAKGKKPKSLEEVAAPKEKKPKKDFQLYKAIQAEKDYKSNIGVRDRRSRKYIEENFGGNKPKSVLPGQLVMFNYFEPKTKEELEYYDAMPCTIFFGIIKTDNGPRVIGFNIHYYPPRIRYQLLDRIFDIFKPIYLKSWDGPLKTELSRFDYKMLMEQLRKAKLDFGIREYIPRLMASVTPIPPKAWSKAVFTEGRFKKRTREAIMDYWQKKIIDKTK